MRLLSTSPIKASPPPACFDIGPEIASTRPTKGHQSLARVLRSAFKALDFEFAKSWADPGWRDGYIRGATGRIVSEAPREWILARMHRAGASWRAEAAKLQHSKLRRTHFACEPLYFTGRYGPAAWDFLQVRVQLAHEFQTTDLLPAYWTWDRAEDVAGWPSFQDQAPAIGPQHYKLDELLDVAEFVETRAAQWRQAFMQRLPIVAEKRITTIFIGDNRSIEQRIGDLPDFERTPGRWRLQRLFDDWSASSAGVSGERIERHWVIQGNEVPRWVNDPRLPNITKARVTSDRSFVDWLERFDRKAGYPFAWYFYMLHGNKIRSEHGEWAMRLAQQGTLRLPDCDFEVLRRWAERTYGF